MITKQLINPQSIVVVGGSNDVRKPGGKVLKNLLEHNFKGKLYVVNPKNEYVQGLKAYKDLKDLPQVDLAILAIPAQFCPDTVKILAEEKGTKAFIVLSAGFAEESQQGARLQQQMVEIVNKAGASLIGPNCIGVLNTNYAGVFTTPIPKLDPKGVDMISGSGATAVFIMESALPKGLTFNSIWSVGNSAQIGVEEVLEYLDKTFDPQKSSKVKLLYIEKIDRPQKFLKHAKSLIQKGCKIAAIKAGRSEAGTRAASSHTGALASSDLAVDALLRKAGVIRCYSREQLVTVASILLQKPLKGNRIAIVTHAGGPGVMLTDTLSLGGMEIPPVPEAIQKDLLEHLFPGSSAVNPIDFLATGTAQQLDYILETCQNKCDFIDAIAVIFGTPGLFKVFDAYDVIHKHIITGKKPVYPIMPSTSEAAEEIKHFQNYGHQSFNDEVLFGQALTMVWNTPEPGLTELENLDEIDTGTIRKVIQNSENGYLPAESVSLLLKSVNIPLVPETIATSFDQVLEYVQINGYPIVMKALGLLHKTDSGGVILNINNRQEAQQAFRQLMQISPQKRILVQKMVSGIELFIGAKKEEKFGHLILAGLGGIFIEAIKDFQAALAPIGETEALWMINKLKAHKVLDGIRGYKPINRQGFAKIISNLSKLVIVAPEIVEMDLNPILASGDDFYAVDARIRIEKRGAAKT